MAIVIVMSRAVKDPNIQEGAGLDHLVEISVHGRLAYSRMRLFYVVINLLGSSVDVEVFHRVIYQLPLYCISFAVQD